MKCILKIHRDVLQKCIAYKYYVQTPNIRKDDDGFEELQETAKFDRHFVNRRLMVDKFQKGIIYCNIFPEGGWCLGIEVSRIQH